MTMSVAVLTAESWHNPSSGAFVILRRSPELDPVEDQRGFFVVRLSSVLDVRS
jgi:hypothetical protein